MNGRENKKGSKTKRLTPLFLFGYKTAPSYKTAPNDMKIFTMKMDKTLYFYNSSLMTGK